MNNVDFALGEPKHAWLGVNENTPWAVLDLRPAKPQIATPALASVQGRRGEPYYPAGTNHAPRQTKLLNPLKDDPYLSPADKKYAALHDVLRAGGAIAVANANNKPKKKNVASSGIVGESVVVFARLARLLRG